MPSQPHTPPDARSSLLQQLVRASIVQNALHAVGREDTLSPAASRMHFLLVSTPDRPGGSGKNRQLVWNVLDHERLSRRRVLLFLALLPSRLGHLRQVRFARKLRLLRRHGAEERQPPIWAGQAPIVRQKKTIPTLLY